MNRKHLFFAVAVVALLLAACKGENKPKPQAPNEPQMEVTNFDSTTVRQLAADFLELVKQERLDEAMNQLYVYENEKIMPLPDDQREECKFMLGMHHVYDYSVVGVNFFKETDSEVKYKLYIQDPGKHSNPATINGMIKPIRIDGTWYITLANREGKSFDKAFNEHAH
ncbi:MAG: hypothetical protein K5683_00575 [Prevotella sp.]|nr:hypothetical protein [Prevotella sp.]